MAARIVVAAGFKYTSKEMFHEDDKVPRVRLGNQGRRNQGAGQRQRDCCVLRRLREEGQGEPGEILQRDQVVSSHGSTALRPARRLPQDVGRSNEEVRCGARRRLAFLETVLVYGPLTAFGEALV